MAQNDISYGAVQTAEELGRLARSHPTGRELMPRGWAGRGAPSNSRSSGTARGARLRPYDVVETLRVSPSSRGAAQLAPR